MTAAQIAEALGEGITRNAVIGKAHRLGLFAHDEMPAGSEPGIPSESASARADISSSSGRGQASTNKPAVTIAELSEGMCRWPADESSSGELRYCGQTTSGAGPYCARHGKLAYQPARPIVRKLDRHSLFPSVVIEAGKN